MRQERYQFSGIPAANGDSNALVCTDFVDKWIMIVTGSHTATVMASGDNGANYAPVPMGTVAANTNAWVEVPMAATHVKITIGSYVAGTAAAHLNMRNARGE
ncbi:MAG: hypothetical protein HOV80_17690 [Polyangiaceae bacterium]|nr:hypothetical protein [Polyangiaceae bacterium]